MQSKNKSDTCSLQEEVDRLGDKLKKKQERYDVYLCLTMNGLQFLVDDGKIFLLTNHEVFDQ